MFNKNRIMFDNKKFSEAMLTKRVVQLRITNSEAAKEIGTTKATVSRAENGKMIDLNTFGKCCKWLNVNPGIFFND